MAALRLTHSRMWRPPGGPGLAESDLEPGPAERPSPRADPAGANLPVIVTERSRAGPGAACQPE